MVLVSYESAFFVIELIYRAIQQVVHDLIRAGWICVWLAARVYTARPSATCDFVADGARSCGLKAGVVIISHHGSQATGQTNGG